MRVHKFMIPNGKWEGPRTKDQELKDQGCWQAPRIVEHISWQIGELVQLIRSTEVWLAGRLRTETGKKKDPIESWSAIEKFPFSFTTVLTFMHCEK